MHDSKSKEENRREPSRSASDRMQKAADQFTRPGTLARRINQADLQIFCKRSNRSKALFTPKFANISRQRSRFQNDIPEKLNEINKKLRSKDELQDDYKTFSKEKTTKRTLTENAKNESKSQRYVLLSKKRGLNEDNPDMNIFDIISSSNHSGDENIDEYSKGQPACTAHRQVSWLGFETLIP